MKINATKFYTILFVIVIFLQLYVYSFRFNVFFQIFVLGLFIALELPKISYRFLKSAAPVFLIFLLGFVGMMANKYHLFNIIKDIFHFLKPLLGIAIGYCFYKKIGDFKLFVKTIVYTGLLSALVHFGIIASISNIATVSDIRKYGTDNFIELVAILFLAFYKRFQKESLFNSRLTHITLFWILLISSTLYFSRTMIVTAIMALLSIYGYTVITAKTLKIILGLLLFVVAMYSFLFSINISRNKDGLSSFFYKVKNAPAEVFKTHIDRENHADLWDHWRGYEAKRAISLLADNPSGLVCGLGYGSLVNLKFYAPLSDDRKGMKYISELHNGYIYILYKVGIIGILLYLFFLYKLYVRVYFDRSFNKVFISAFALGLFFSTLVTVGINNSNEVIIFIIGALLFFEEKNSSKTAEVC
jgi:hypothetical protein